MDLSRMLYHNNNNSPFVSQSSLMKAPILCCDLVCSRSIIQAQSFRLRNGLHDAD